MIPRLSLVSAAESQTLSDLRDEHSFEQAFRQFFPALCAYAHRFVPDIAAAEEVVQEVFAHLWEKREQVQVNTSLKSYLFRSVHNRCLNQLRNEKVRSLHHQAHQDERAESTFYDPAIEADVKTRVYEAIGRLPAQRGKIFRMSRFEALSYREIAEQLGLSPKTVEAQMSKALGQLREWLKDMRVWWLIIFFWY